MFLICRIDSNKKNLQNKQVPEKIQSLFCAVSLSLAHDIIASKPERIRSAWQMTLVGLSKTGKFHLRVTHHMDIQKSIVKDRLACDKVQLLM